MNSKDRRKAKRDLEKNYPHTVTLFAKNTGMRYFEWDMRVDEMAIWCKKHAHQGWVHKTDWESATFHFTQDQHATFFALRWS